MDSDQFKPSDGTNYLLSYKRSGIALPPLKFHQIPSIALEDAPKLQPRKFPIEPIGPHRRWEKLARFQGELPNIGLFTSKPIVRAPDPKTIRSNIRKVPRALTADITLPEIAKPSGTDGAVADESSEELINRFHWSTTNERAMESAHLPLPPTANLLTEIESTPNPMFLRAKRYEGRPAPWQRVASIWDRCQTRAYVAGIAERQLVPITKTKRRVEPIQRCNRRDGADPWPEKVCTLLEDEELTSTFARQCPGYAGFRPRSPLKGKSVITVRRPQNQAMASTMTSAYRELPPWTGEKYLHKGPMSRTVTLTFPYNPYNKVENRDYFRNNMGSE